MSTTKQYVVKKCGVRFDPPAVVLIYQVKSTGKLHRRTMPLRCFSKRSVVSRFAEELKTESRHKKYLDDVPMQQLEKLITIIKDKLNGIDLETSLEKNKGLDTVDPNEDLNVVDEETLKRKKAIMDQTFEKNRKLPGDPDFQYDVEKDFDVAIESCEWDSDNDSDNEF
ncbi:hypothetical protein LSH36_377g02033 [Paralvinella palmiformis]|uniref:Centrosomal protein of 19 kDa n=1 Tax=Paralvinella palmiformis TaxID=53620 RepID=A0AAD9MZ12_9ANNE|nr:hypothetical protein LSH36_377g02033 [Paralvinella palmiformis]